MRDGRTARAYLKTLADRYLDNSAETPRFARNIDEAQNVLRNRMNMNALCMVAYDFRVVRIVDSTSNNKMAECNIRFMLLRKCPPQDFEAQENAHFDATNEWWNMTLNFEGQRKDYVGNLKDYLPTTANIEEVGPEFDNAFGVMCSFNYLTTVP